MRKIPTMFVRNPEDLRRVTSQVTPGCEWVVFGEGRATRKFDGTCIMIRDGKMFKRREVKPGKPTPADFNLVETDQNTGKSVGWVPVGDGPEDRFHREPITDDAPEDGTYELIGPKVQGNPEGAAHHMLIRHGCHTVECPRDFAGLAAWLSNCEFEGVVFHHDDGRMAKIKKRDF